MKIIVTVLENQIASVHEAAGITTINSEKSQILVDEIENVVLMLKALNIEDLSPLRDLLLNDYTEKDVDKMLSINQTPE